MDNITIRPRKSGESSYVSYMQMKFYELTYGFKEIFEHYLLSSMAEFIGSPTGSQLWVALDDNKIIGSIAIIKAESYTAQLRWFIVDEQYQGNGIGKRLMDTAMRFSKEQGYNHIFLWTIQKLDAARHLYKQYDFKRTDQISNTEWTSGILIEERWDLLLQEH